MEKAKTVEKDPIKDKYNQKLGFFNKIKVKYSILRQKLKDNKSLMDDFEAVKLISINVITYGILGSLSATLVGINIGILSFFGIGAALWLIENKLVEIITRILGSIKFVEITNY